MKSTPKNVMISRDIQYDKAPGGEIPACLVFPVLRRHKFNPDSVIVPLELADGSVEEYALSADEYEECILEPGDVTRENILAARRTTKRVRDIVEQVQHIERSVETLEVHARCALGDWLEDVAAETSALADEALGVYTEQGLKINVSDKLIDNWKWQINENAFLSLDQSDDRLEGISLLRRVVKWADCQDENIWQPYGRPAPTEFDVLDLYRACRSAGVESLEALREFAPDAVPPAFR